MAAKCVPAGGKGPCICEMVGRVEQGARTGGVRNLIGVSGQSTCCQLRKIFQKRVQVYQQLGDGYAGLLKRIWAGNQ